MMPRPDRTRLLIRGAQVRVLHGLPVDFNHLLLNYQSLQSGVTGFSFDTLTMAGIITEVRTLGEVPR